MNRDYHLGLLCLTHLLVGADGVVAESETDALRYIQENEMVPPSVYSEFENLVQHKKERDIFQTGIDLLNRCTNEEKIKVFVMLYKLSEVDGRVHVKEIRLLLYSIKLAGVEFEDLVLKAMATPPLL